jgi:two-component system, OmpR family, KDP operon response regulator KdpE
VVTKPSILAVDDDRSILTIVQISMENEADVTVATSGEEALEKLPGLKPDILLLDLIMPGASGFDVLQAMRPSDITPVIVVTAMDTSVRKALDMGADDFISKPFNPDELKARVNAVLRRSRQAAAAPRIVKSGNVTVDLDRRIVTKNGQHVHMTRTEWLLLQKLASHPGRAIFNSQILASVWGPEYSHDLTYLRVWISRLRSKLEDDSSHPQVIQTIGGSRYMLRADREEE